MNPLIRSEPSVFNHLSVIRSTIWVVTRPYTSLRNSISIATTSDSQRAADYWLAVTAVPNDALETSENRHSVGDLCLIGCPHVLRVSMSFLIWKWKFKLCSPVSSTLWGRTQPLPRAVYIMEASYQMLKWIPTFNWRIPYTAWGTNSRLEALRGTIQTTFKWDMSSGSFQSPRKIPSSLISNPPHSLNSLRKHDSMWDRDSVYWKSRHHPHLLKKKKVSFVASDIWSVYMTWLE